jgi:hypothetical protein
MDHWIYFEEVRDLCSYRSMDLDPYRSAPAPEAYSPRRFWKVDEDDDRHTHHIPEMHHIWAQARGGQLTDDEKWFLDRWEREVLERPSGTKPTKGAER